MTDNAWPSFGRLIEYLRGFGFDCEADRAGRMSCVHPEEGSWFWFRDRAPESPAREIELLDVRSQLTWRGFVTEEDFERFWSRGVGRMRVSPTST